MDWAAIYLIIPGYYRTHGNKSLFSINLPYSVSFYLNVSFIHNTNSDYVLKQLCHNVHDKNMVHFYIYKK